MVNFCRRYFEKMVIGRTDYSDMPGLKSGAFMNAAIWAKAFKPSIVISSKVAFNSNGHNLFRTEIVFI